MLTEATVGVEGELPTAHPPHLPSVSVVARTQGARTAIPTRTTFPPYPSATSDCKPTPSAPPSHDPYRGRNELAPRNIRSLGAAPGARKASGDATANPLLPPSSASQGKRTLMRHRHTNAAAAPREHARGDAHAIPNPTPPTPPPLPRGGRAAKAKALRNASAIPRA